MLGEKIKKIRENQKLGLNETAKLAGISGSYLSNIEKGIKSNPSMEALNKIAQALNVPVDEFFKDIPIEIEHLCPERTFSNRIYPDPKNLTIKEQKNLDTEAQQIVNNLAMSLSKNKEHLKEEDYLVLETTIRSALETIKLKNKEKYTPKKYKDKQEE